MGFRITTWNESVTYMLTTHRILVNGISKRNPFSYEPWRGTRTFESMFNILEADIVILQETKIQRKDLRDDMVLVPGWDWYSGVVIYTRNATCSPIRAEEGITGVLCPPKSSTSFRDLPEDQQIGGYPTSAQLSRPSVCPGVLDSEEDQENVGSISDAKIDAPTLDSEGRCVILEFPAFVLIGVYCPAYRDESRDNFRMDFLNALDSRVRNLIAMGKRVIVTGDINISKHSIDAAHGIEAIRKGTMTEEEFISSPSRRLFNQLTTDGVVIGERDEGREQPVLFDVCRSFHPDRTGMYTCWDQKLNARPGNYGSRIDYLLCSLDMQDWFSGANIQEGLMGSDHCPVYAVIKDSVKQAEGEINIRDILNPAGLFNGGKRQRECLNEWALPASGRLLPEFDIDKRRSIKDMFARKSSNAPPKALKLAAIPASTSPTEGTDSMTMHKTFGSNDLIGNASASITERNQSSQTFPRKRSQPSPSTFTKRPKSTALTSSSVSASDQKTLMSFFKPEAVDVCGATQPPMDLPGLETPSLYFQQCGPSHAVGKPPGIGMHSPRLDKGIMTDQKVDTSTESQMASKPKGTNPGFIDPIASKDDWSKLFAKKSVPPCDGHHEPCISLTAKKPGMNCGRSFWICPRPLGPSGEKEQGTHWRCHTFIWASDWKSAPATYDQ
ncbi:Endonuclease/exonuclease/phosphatase [Penicillium paradoxum]|uniref:Endonuclease/exonuclease/phosphatase n=1 Tax=Penicillium paradoxum TaxID=176176 RepID=UPI002548C4DC|nr:Endonuclease/exonuclease/phosphatase [Penicillium paradoxum]KAJ5780953.1 Endonuclease/exonuclease/phosphatase [Penicillium paradoxum]